MWASNLSGSVSLGARFGPRCQHRYSARSPSVSGSRAARCPQRAARHTGPGSTPTIYRDIKRGVTPESVEYDLEQILR